MTDLPYIAAREVEHLMRWGAVADALWHGHKSARAEIGDTLFKVGDNALLSRAAWVPGLGIGTKVATVFPGNKARQPALPSTHAVCTLFDADTGVPSAIIDGALVTKWKTSGDSVLGARLLARPDAQVLVVVGAGLVAAALISAYTEVFAGLKKVLIWNRNFENAQALAARCNVDGKEVRAHPDLAGALAEADIVSCATMATEPVIRGEWVRPGTHVDLIGAYRPDMREADDTLISTASLFVDARETTLHDIGELAIPLAAGVITEADVRADLY
ncbi:MAG: ornithine cyclodeaminase family protein, partial [Halocynthiibacter sp.]